MGAGDSMKARVLFRTVFIVIFFLLLVGTTVYMLTAPEKEDARIREELGDPLAFVTDTARSPWIHVGEDGVPHVYHEDCIGFTVLRLPEVVNGVSVSHIGNAFQLAMPDVERLIFPSTVTHPRIDVSFIKWTSLKEIVFREGVQDMTSTLLYATDALEAIYFPKSLSALGWSVLREGEGNPTIYYAGTEEEWLALGSNAKRIAGKYTVVYETPVPEEWLESTKSPK